MSDFCDELPDFSCYDGLLWWYQADLLCRGPSIDIDDLDSWTFENWAQWYVVGVEWSSLCGSTLPPWATVRFTRRVHEILGYVYSPDCGFVLAEEKLALKLVTRSMGVIKDRPIRRRLTSEQAAFHDSDSEPEEHVVTKAPKSKRVAKRLKVEPIDCTPKRGCVELVNDPYAIVIPDE